MEKRPHRETTAMSQNKRETEKGARSLAGASASRTPCDRRRRRGHARGNRGSAGRSGEKSRTKGEDVRKAHFYFVVFVSIFRRVSLAAPEYIPLVGVEADLARLPLLRHLAAGARARARARAEGEA